MSPNQWGPPTWTLFHTLAEKINEAEFPTLMPQLIFFIRRICSVLPCPECSQHATTFWKKVNVPGIQNKNDLRNLLCMFHNIVNKRKNKPLFNHDKLTETYSSRNSIDVYNHFVSVYQTNGNMNLIADAFQRKMILVQFKKWIMTNFRHFI
jgi:hypothetical protein